MVTLMATLKITQEKHRDEEYRVQLIAKQKLEILQQRTKYIRDTS